MAKKRSTRKRKTSTRKGRSRASAPAQSNGASEANEPSAPIPAQQAQTAVYTWAFAATAPAAPPQRMPVYPAPGPEPAQAPFHAPLQPRVQPHPVAQPPMAQPPMAQPAPALPRAPAQPEAPPADAPRAPELPYRSKGVRPVKLELEKSTHGAVIHSRSGAPEATAQPRSSALETPAHSPSGSPEAPAPKKRRGGGARSISETYEALAQILVPYARMFQSEMHPRMGYCLRAKTTERPPKELYFGGVQLHQEHVSFHLFPLYSFPDLEAKLSPELRQRQEGKTSFHIERGADPALLRELDSLTRACFERLRSQGLNGNEPA